MELLFSSLIACGRKLLNSFLSLSLEKVHLILEFVELLDLLIKYNAKFNDILATAITANKHVRYKFFTVLKKQTKKAKTKNHSPVTLTYTVVKAANGTAATFWARTRNIKFLVVS